MVRKTMTAAPKFEITKYSILMCNLGNLTCEHSVGQNTSSCGRSASHAQCCRVLRLERTDINVKERCMKYYNLPPQKTLFMEFRA